MVEVPAPVMLAPMADRSPARSDFGLTGTVLKDGLAFSENSGHKKIFRAGHCDLVEHDVRALQPIGSRFEIAMLLGDDSTHCLQPLM